MAEDLSILARLTQRKMIASNDRQRGHFVTKGECALLIANQEYNLQIYSPDRWREIIIENGIENPARLDTTMLGRRLSIPPVPIPGLETIDDGQ